VLAVVRMAAARYRTEEERSVLELIDGGESASLELKSTARVNLHSGKRDARIELVVAKTIAGFMNADGGTLLVGVADDGSIHGLRDDYETCQRPNRDSFELWLSDYLGNILGRNALSGLAVSFESFGGKDVCRIDVARAEKPVFVARPGGARTADFYVRMGNATRQLLTDEALEYTASRWR
jgi:predicted HTH transcriptional regulator